MMFLGRSLVFLLGISTTTTLAGASVTTIDSSHADDEKRLSLLSSFHHSAKKSIETHARRVLVETQKQQRRHHRQLQDENYDDDFGDFTLCMFLGPMFDDALESNPAAPKGNCTCDDTTNPDDLTIACAFQDVCDETQLFNGSPTCASSVEITYTISGLGSAMEDLFATSPPGEGEDTVQLSMTSTATVDMSNPDLEVYTVSFQLDMSGALDDSTTAGGDSTLSVMGSCEATYDSQPCECTLEIENLVDEDITNDDDYCINVDCSMVTPNWPPMKEGSCNSVESSETGTTLEASSFLLAFDDSTSAVTDDSGEETTATTTTTTTENGTGNNGEGTGEDENSGAFRFFSIAFLGGSLAAAFLMV